MIFFIQLPFWWADRYILMHDPLTQLCYLSRNMLALPQGFLVIFSLHSPYVLGVQLHKECWKMAQVNILSNSRAWQECNFPGDHGGLSSHLPPSPFLLLYQSSIIDSSLIQYILIKIFSLCTPSSFLPTSPLAQIHSYCTCHQKGANLQRERLNMAKQNTTRVQSPGWGKQQEEKSSKSR